MRFALRNVVPNPYRRFDMVPLDPDKIAELKESIGTTGWWEGIIGRKVGDQLQIAFGHNRLAALKELYGPDEVFDWKVVEFTDAEMIKAMSRENRTVYASTAQSLLESIRVTVQAFAEGKITEKEMPPPAAKAHHVRFAPSFRPSVTESVTDRTHAYTAETLGKFLGYLKANGTAKEQLMICLDALDLNETGDFPDQVLGRMETVYGDLQDEVEERMEARETKRRGEEEEKEDAEKKQRAEEHETQEKTFAEKLKEAKEELAAAEVDRENKKKVHDEASQEHSKAEKRAEETDDAFDIKEAKKSLQRYEELASEFVAATKQVYKAQTKLTALLEEQKKETARQAKEEKKRKEKEAERAEKRKQREAQESERSEKKQSMRTVQIEIVKAGYKQLAIKRHPDHGGTHEGMVALTEAFEDLAKKLDLDDFDDDDLEELFGKAARA